MRIKTEKHVDARVNTDTILYEKEKILDVTIGVFPDDASICMNECAELTCEQVRSISISTLGRLAEELDAACWDELSRGSFDWSVEWVDRFCDSGIVRRTCENVLGFAPRWLEESEYEA